MRPVFLIAALLSIASPPPGLANLPPHRYTSLVIQFVGEMDRPVAPIVISTSPEEAEWYNQELFKEPIGVLVGIEVVPAKTLASIAELPLLNRALRRAKPTEEEPKTTPTVRFIAGSGHDYLQIMLDAQTSRKILGGIEKTVIKYPTLVNKIREVDSLLNQAAAKR